jgi:hypothetical protein
LGSRKLKYSKVKIVAAVLVLRFVVVLDFLVKVNALVGACVV